MDIEQLAGTRLGNHEIESLLGRGGMGVVYKARQLSLDRPVALKVLPPSLSSDASYIKRFQREAKAVAKLSHPNIVQIYDIAQEKDLHFFSMEYVKDQTLDDLLRDKGKLEVDDAVKLITQAAQGIEHAHRIGIIHRDIKPSNIIVDEFGNVKVMDFGLARMTGDHSKLTQSGTLMGTLEYMSPEQCRGEDLDERTDIYSLGVVLYEMLTGRTPFDAPNEAALIYKIISEEPAEAKKLNPNIPDDLSIIVSRAISKDRDERYAVISEFLKELREVRKQTSSPSIEERKPSPSIAVLPFVNMSADPEQEYFCDGLAEELINALTQLRDLRVVARTSAFSFKGEKADIQEIGRKLKVGTILEGSVRKAGNRLRITAQLVKVDDGYHLWSERYDREMEDVFAIQDEITLAIVEKLKPRLFREEKAKLANRQTVDLGAYNLYLKGRYFWGKATLEGLEKAVEYFEKTIEKDPSYALAYAGLADAEMYRSFWGGFPPKETYPKARAAALKALEIDDTLAEAITSLARIKHSYDWDWDGAERGYRQAIDFNPGYATAHQYYALCLMHQGRFEQAVKEVERAYELDPFSLHINVNVGQVYLYARDYDAAITSFRKTIEMDPDHPTTHLFLGFAYLGKSMYEEAMAELQKEKKLAKCWRPGIEIALGGCHSLMGQKDTTRLVLNELLKQSKQQYIPPYLLALLYFALEEDDHGFEWLNEAYETHDSFLYYLKIEPTFDTLRSDSRYLALLKKIGLDK